VFVLLWTLSSAEREVVVALIGVVLSHVLVCRRLWGNEAGSLVPVTAGFQRGQLILQN
jgi:hypothetical protein